MITTVFFDLDGTLLPMEQEKFINAYLKKMATKMAMHGYDPKQLVASIWNGTGAMVKNTSSKTNEEVFWESFSSAFGRNTRADEHIFNEFYQNEFQDVKYACGFDPRASSCIAELETLGLQLVLATNPLFPAIATHSRIRWAGLQPENFCHITTYENASRCKPNPDYYREILGKLNLNAANCLMVGNDVEEDMIAASLGMQVFLMTDCLINSKNQDISQYPHGSFPELMDFIRSVMK